ncbi:hypothetical protein SK128_004095, partial [Halocaridina rubra]
MVFDCVDGKWDIKNRIIHACVPDCSDNPCLNGGVCVQPKTCACDPRFTGSSCEIERCYWPPKYIVNAIDKLQTSESSHMEYELTCNQGYILINKNQTMKAKCENGIWQFPQGFQNSYRVTCVPYCDPPCFNGGRCVGPNTCTCPEGFFGQSCTKRYITTDRRRKRCLFPFKYMQKWYFGCTADYYYMPWCATDVTDMMEMTDWGICRAEVGIYRLQTTKAGHQCFFPFKHKDQLHYACSSKDGFTSWCGTKLNMSLAPVKKGTCRNRY